MALPHSPYKETVPAKSKLGKGPLDKVKSRSLCHRQGGPYAVGVQIDSGAVGFNRSPR